MSSMSREVFHRKIFSEPFSWKCFGIIFLIRAQNFPKKIKFPTPDTQTYTCVSGGEQC